jgi:pyridoxal 5'-phosphate synthase pdxT subunit
VRAKVGVLALQGDFAEHLETLQRCGVSGFEVRTREQLEDAGVLIIPGGESTTMLKLIDRFDLRDLLAKRIKEGMPALGTCAGAIVLARECSDGEPPLGVLDITVKRNAYGRQIESFECDLGVPAIEGGPMQVAFIRAPVIESVGEDVEVLASWADRPVLVRSGSILATAFHTEVTGETRLHRYFLDEMVNA